MKLVELKLRDYKCFSSLSLSLSKINLLTGLNGAGKSTAIQSLLLLSQSVQASQNLANISLNGSLVGLGSLSDITRVGASFYPDLSVTIDDEPFTFTLSGGSASRFVPCETASLSDNASQLLSEVVFISAARDIESPLQHMPSAPLATPASVGRDGRYSCHTFFEQSDNDVCEQKRMPGEIGTTFRKQVNAWLSYLFPGSEVNVQLVQGLEHYLLQFRSGPAAEWVRPENTGFGISYCLPIIVALLSAQPGQVITIDSPEAHLHPQAQSKMGILLSHFAAAGVQIIVETHSDHVVNGLRLAVKREQIAPEDAKIFFFSGANENDSGVMDISIDKDGRVSDWPSGFFDQGENDLLDLLDFD